MIRRFVLVLGLSVLLVLGFGAAYGLSSALNGESLLGVLKGHTPVVICHKPGTPAEHTIIVDDDAVPAHLAHGDHLGPCGAVVTTTLTSATTTLTTPTVTSVPITETDPPTTVTQPPDDDLHGNHGHGAGAARDDDRSRDVDHSHRAA